MSPENMGMASDLVAEVAKSVAKLCVAPAGVFLGHPDNQIGDILVSFRAPRPTLLRAVVLLRHEPPIPSEDGVRRDDPGDLAEHLAAQQLALHGKAPALFVGQARPTATKLLSEDAVLFEQVVDGLLLLAVDPAGEHQQEEVENGGNGRSAHDGNVRHRSVAAQA